MRSPSFYQKRLQDLADNIAKDLELLKDFEDELRYETNPRVKARYRREIGRQQESVTRYKQEYVELQQKLTGSPSTQMQMQKVDSQLQQMDAKLNILLSGKDSELYVAQPQTQPVPHPQTEAAPPSPAVAPQPEPTSGSENQAIEVFFSYAHEDEELRDELAKHLKLLERQKVISAWYDRDISAGDDWKQEIEQRLNSADVILLLISADFLASDFCWGVELDRAMERHETVQARVIPIILREVDWKGAPFGKLQALPKNAEPVTNWANRDQAFADIARGIRQVVKELQEPEELEKPVSPSPKLGETQRSQETTSPSPKPPTVLPEKR